MNQIQVCIIGAGNLASRRIYPYIAASKGRLVGICDLDYDKAQEKALLYGGRAYSNYTEMLREEQPDAVIVCIGPEQHYVIAKQIMSMGIPVYTEKPSAPSSAQALELARHSEATGVLCTTAFKKRYASAFYRAKEWVQQFEPSQHVSISVDYASGYYDNQSPRTEFLLDFAIHHIDVTSYLFGEAKDVFCFAKGLEGYAVSVKYVSGAVGSFNFNCARSFGIPTEEVELSVQGGNFMTIHNSSSWKITEREKTIEFREPPTFISAGDSGNDTGHFAEIVDFFEAVRDKRSTRSNIYESYKSMVLYEAIKFSAESGKVVSVHYER